MLIGLNGNKEVGKDTIGQYLVEEYGFQRIAFADKLKEAVANLFNLPLRNVDEWKTIGEVPRAEVILEFDTTQWSWGWREFLQRFGTEMGRNTFGQNFWVDLAIPSDFDSFSHNTVVTDARFPNEAVRIMTIGGYMVEVLRPGCEPDGHASEERLDKDLLDAQIINNGTLDELYDDVDQLVEDIRSERVDTHRVSSWH